jgi:copper resistance protein B
VLYNHLLTDSWDLQIGVREDFLFGPGRDRSRTLAAFGLNGTAPLRIEVTPAFFVSQDGETSARLEARTDLPIVGNLVAQPRFELNVAFQNAERYGIRSGASDIEVSLRLRYARWSYAAPYVGIQWIRLLGDTADFARDEGDGVDELGVVAGFRIVY